MKRITCFILTLALLIAASPAAFAAVFGEELKSDTSTIAEGTELTNVIDWSSRGFLRENYVTYTPNDNVVPTVVYGSKLCNYGSYSSMADLLESRGRHAIACVNGDYYDTATYAPLGIVISDGRLISSDAGHYAVAFREDGSAFVCEPKIEMSFVAAGEKFPVTFFNKVRTGSYFTLLTDEFAYNTKNTSPGTDVILSVPEGTEITVNCSFTATVEDIVKSRGAMDIPAGKLVLTVSDESDPWRLGMLDTISFGSTLDFTFSCSDERFENVTCAVGALYRLLEDGSVCSGLDNTANPRTALGVKSDGSTVLYTVDGRQSGYSAGASMNEVAKRLLELGCTDAALLDGGGSTHMSAIFVGADGVTQINSPSGGSPRSVTSYLMLTTDASAKSGTAAILGISPMSVQLLCGARTNFGFGAADSAGYPALTPGRLDAALGTITQSGAYTAPDTPCTDTVTYSSAELESVSAAVNVIETPDTLNLLRSGSSVSSVTLKPGESIDFSASATYNRLPLTAQDDCFAWECSGVGTVSDTGEFHANTYNCSGTLTVHAGEKSLTVPVTVKGEPYLLCSFEPGMNTFVGNCERNADKDFIARGDHSMRLDYSLENGGTQLVAAVSLAPRYSYLHFWVYGDSSGNTLRLNDDLSLTLDFSGWRLISTTVTPGQNMSFSVSGSGSGSVYLDHIVCSPVETPDTALPELTLTQSGTSVTATYSEEATVSLTLDGTALHFSEKNRTLSASLPNDGQFHRVSLTATDTYGNISRKSILVSGIPTGILTDMTGHWAEPYAEHLLLLGLIGGYENADGTRFYDPDTAMTRADFAVIVAKWLKLDLAAYENVELPFDDLADIGEGYLPYIRAVYALDIVRGTTDGGELLFAPDSPLTRAQAMTIIGRVQPRGYAESDLPFSDAADVENWALPFVRTLVAQGVVNGHDDGTLKPNDSVTRAEVTKIISAII